MTEAIPIPATALVPLIAFPVAIWPELDANGELALDADGDPIQEGVGVDAVGASYGNNIIFLFMGGFMLALAMQRWNLHKRVALVTVRTIGTNPAMVVAGFMVATGFISMWVSNTATAVMMLPIGVSVLLLVTNLTGDDDDGSSSSDDQSTDSKVKDAVIRSNFGTALMLGIAYAASLGSLATIIGTPPNALLVGYLADNHDITIGFGQWMLVGGPLAIVFLTICWFLLTKVLYKPEIEEIPGGRALLTKELDKLGSMTSGEKRVLSIFVLAAVSWVFVPIIFVELMGWDDPPISDAGIAMAVAALLFLLPAGHARGVRLLDWDTAVKLPWGILLLFGGGLALSSQFGASGLSAWIGVQAEPRWHSGHLVGVGGRHGCSVPHGDHQQYGNGRDVPSLGRRSGYRYRCGSDAAGDSAGHRRDLRVHAARGNPA